MTRLRQSIVTLNIDLEIRDLKVKNPPISYIKFFLKTDRNCNVKMGQALKKFFELTLCTNIESLLTGLFKSKHDFLATD